jgi:1-phosphofructokinase
MSNRSPRIVAVSLNASFDRTLEVPDLQVGSHVQGRLVAVHPAGKAANVARLLGLMKTPCTLTGFVGRGDLARFQESFQGTPVAVDLLEAGGRTRENITLIDPVRGTETHIRQAGFTLTDDDLERLAGRLADLAAPGAYVAFAGSLPPGVDADRFGRLIRICREKGARVAVDSSGPGLEAVCRASGLWLLKPNREELAELTPLLRGESPYPPRTMDRAAGAIEDDADLRAAALPLLAHAEQVIVTLGADGACLFTREGAWRARPPRLGPRGVKTVGAGDALLAGFIQARAAGNVPPDDLRQGVAWAAASCLQMRAGEVNAEDVAACLEGVDLSSC